MQAAQDASLSQQLHRCACAAPVSCRPAPGRSTRPSCAQLRPYCAARTRALTYLRLPPMRAQGGVHWAQRARELLRAGGREADPEPGQLCSQRGASRGRQGAASLVPAPVPEPAHGVGERRAGGACATSAARWRCASRTCMRCQLVHAAAAAAAARTSRARCSRTPVRWSRRQLSGMACRCVWRRVRLGVGSTLRCLQLR